ncbi:hypothetical protein MRX96_034582 [Rhipicephalus microplus]
MITYVLLFAVVGRLSSASSDGLPTTVTEDSGVCSGTPLSSFSAHHSSFFRVSHGLLPNLDFTVFAVRQHGATSADPPLQKRAGCIDTSGHGTAAADRCSPIMYLQVLLFAVVGQLSSASSDGLPTRVTEDSGMCSGTPLSSFSAHHSPFFQVSDGLPPNLDFTVFAVRQHGATSADPPLQKRAGCIDTSGHGTAAADRCSPIMYLQYTAHRSPAHQAEHPLHTLDPSARIHRLPCAMDSLPLAPHECPSMFPPVPPSLLLPFPSWSQGTEAVLTSHR